MLGVLTLAFLSVMAASVLATGNTSQEAAPPDQKMPPGQLVRESISGPVVAAADDLSSITVGTKFGNLLVSLTSETVVNAPPDKDVGLDAITVGSKVVVKLNRPPLDKQVLEDEEPPPLSTGDEEPPPLSTGDEEPPPLSTGDEAPPPLSITEVVPPFRTVMAQLIIVLPNKATRSHKRAVLKCQTTDTLEVIGEDGSVEVLGDESTGDAGTENGPSNSTGDDTQETTNGNGDCVSSGDDLILLTQKKSRDSDDLVVRATERAEKIDQRLEKIIARLES